jgi:ParB family chromosome partitioning protein
MSARRGEWISKRGQLNVATAIDQVLERQPDEQVHLLDDTQIEDSPYQARRPFNDASVEALAQGMREIGFQGVLIVRPHGEPLKQRHGRYQLVYGHRRRAAWRRVCAERGERCLLPVVIREVSDERMLTIGAQENLQREDLDPVEEAQIVAWHQRMFSDKNQSEIGAMLGKSSDWVSMRARIHKLPEALKERLRLRPRAVSQILELGSLAAERPDEALRLADRVVAENLTLEAVRHLLRGYARPEQSDVLHRDKIHNRRGAATIVQEGTSAEQLGVISEPATDVQESPLAQRGSDIGTADPSPEQMADDMPLVVATGMDDTASDLDRVQAVAATLTVIAGRAGTLPYDSSIMHSLDQAEHALGQIRSVLARAALSPNNVAPRPYQLAETNLSDMAVALLRQRPSLVTVQHGQRLEMTLHLICFLMPWNGAHGQSTHARPNDLFVAVSGAGHGVLPLIEGLPVERVRNSLGLPAEGAGAVAALMGDLARAQAQLQ